MGRGGSVGRGSDAGADRPIVAVIETGLACLGRQLTRYSLDKQSEAIPVGVWRENEDYGNKVSANRGDT